MSLAERCTRGTMARIAVMGVLVAACGIAGCGQPPPERPEGQPAVAVQAVATGDLDAITARGTLRLARRRWASFETLPRQGLPAEAYFRLAEEFAGRRGLAVEWRTFDGFDALIPAVRDGLADVAVSNITVTEARARAVAFTTPVTRTREWLLGRRPASSAPGAPLSSYAGRTFGIPRGTAYLDSMTRYMPQAPVIELAAGLDPHQVLEALEAGSFDATIMDGVVARGLTATSETVEQLAVLPGSRDLAWAIRHDSPQLLDALDTFLEERLLAGGDAPARQDLEGVRTAGRLRMLTLNGPGTYYLWRGELLGFEYELMQAFAQSLGVVLEVVVAPHRADLLPWLEAGRGDVISAGLTATAARRAAGQTFSKPYLRVHEVFVSRAPLESVESLAGQRVTVQEGSSFVESLETLQRDVHFEVERSGLESEGLIQTVAEGGVDITLADSHIAELEAAFDERLALGPRLPVERGLAWVVRPDQPALLAALNDFIEARYRGYEYNVLRNKYFRNARRMQRQRDHRLVGEELSPYDDLVKAVATEHDLDWRLVVSQMYQESGFDPREVSAAGARGLMQVMPRTARDVGVAADALADPGQGIAAGVRYLSWTRERFESLPLRERHWFALAAYNAGVGHVRDARRLARIKGWDTARWFDHVEHAMLLLAEREYAREAVYGYVRGSEPVRYVGEIRERYRAYLGHLEALREAPEAPASSR